MSEDKKKIAILIPSLHGGGAERSAVELYYTLSSEYGATIINLESGCDFDTNMRRILLTQLDGRANRWYKIAFFPIQLIKLIQTLKVHKYTLVIAFMERASMFMALISKFTNLKVVYSFRNYQSKQILEEKVERGISTLRRLAYTWLMKNIAKSGSIVITVSEQAKRDLVVNYGFEEDKVKVIYNSYDIDKIRRLSTDDLSEYDDIFKYPTIVSAGRLVKQKGHWHIIRIYRKVKKEIKGLKLVILGEGELKHKLVDLAKSLGLRVFVNGRNQLSTDYDVYMLGYQKNPFKFFAKAKVFAFTSLWEGFPNALVEAMVCGAPVISTDCRSGPREILAPDSDYMREAVEAELAKYGILMPNFKGDMVITPEPLDDVELIWANTLVKVLSDQELQSKYSELSLERAMHFSRENIARQWLEIIESYV